MTVLTNKKILPFFTTVIIIVIVTIYYQDALINIYVNRHKVLLSSLDKIGNTNEVSCKLRKLPVYSLWKLEFFKSQSTINCSSVSPDWVLINESYIIINKKVEEIYGITILCQINELYRISENIFQNNSLSPENGVYVLKNSDIVNVSCRSKKTSDKWQSVLVGLRRDESVTQRTGWSKLPPNALKLNVLMFGFNSLSLNTASQKLPKTYYYLTQILGGHILENYNIIGSGSLEALIPLLTGQTQNELAAKNSSYQDMNPYIWKQFSTSGYVTAFLEDEINANSLNYKLKDLNKSTDHYMGPYYVLAKEIYNHSTKFCFGNTLRHNIMINYIKNFFSVYKDKPKFLFGFYRALSNDTTDMLEIADEDVLEFLKYLKKSGILNDTILIFMSDHGPRFGPARNSVQGYNDERLPFFSFTFPRSFKMQYPVAYMNFKRNTKRLTTPFDIYSTLKSILNYDNLESANLQRKAISLFHQISEKRTCEEAGIGGHWCTCAEWVTIPIRSPVVEDLVAILTVKLNDYTANYRNICEILSVENVVSVTHLATNPNLLRFSVNKDGIGQVDSVLYQIKVLFSPGKLLFEATISHFFRKFNFVLHLNDISRIDTNDLYSNCVKYNLYHLENYCSCKENIKENLYMDEIKL